MSLLPTRAAKLIRQKCVDRNTCDFGDPERMACRHPTPPRPPAHHLGPEPRQTGQLGLRRGVAPLDCGLDSGFHAAIST